MRKSNHALIRAALRTRDDGATLSELERALNIAQSSLYRALNAMPDAYVDRWSPVGPGQFAAVWCVVPVPEHCPRPEVRA